MENETVTESTEATANEAQEVQEAQSAEVETQDTDAQPAQAKESPKVSDSDRLKELVKKSKDAEKAKSLTDDDLDFLEKHDFGNKPPKEDKKKPEAKKDAEKEEGESPDPLSDVLKELGAKEAKDILPKVKELRKQLTGKDAQTVAKLTKDNEALTGRVRNEMALWNDVRSGNPQAVERALAFVEKAYGVKLYTQPQAQGQALTGDGLISRDDVIDGDLADKVNGVVSGLRNEIRALQEKLTAEDNRRAEASAKDEAAKAAIDEMVTIAGLKGLESLKEIPNLRQAIKDWYAGKDDPRFEVFDQIIAIANEKKTDLETAWAVLRARGADLEIAKAKQEGRAEAYNQKPSKTLSGMQGKGQTDYTNYTDAQLQEMSQDPRKVPPEWFNDREELDPKRVPKRAHRYLFPSLAKEE